MTKIPPSSADSSDEDTEGHRRRVFADEESAEGEEDTEGHRHRVFADEESTEGETED